MTRICKVKIKHNSGTFPIRFHSKRPHLSPNHANTTTSYASTQAVGVVRFCFTGGTNAMCRAETPPLKGFGYCLSQSDCGRCHASAIQLRGFWVRRACRWLLFKKYSPPRCAAMLPSNSSEFPPFQFFQKEICT